MAMSAESRSKLYKSFNGVVGKEATETLLAQFPTHEGEQPITRDYLRGEMADLRGELRGEMADLRGELQGEIASLRIEFKSDLAGLGNDLRGEISGVKDELHSALATQQRTMLGWMLTIVLAVNSVTFALSQAIA